MSPARPAAHLVWPIDDLTEPTTQSPSGSPGVAEELPERLDLDDVAQRGAGAVGLDVADGAGRDAGLGVGALEGAHLAFDDRGGQAASPAVARGADALDDRVDAVAVALGVGQPLENERGHAFADDDSIGTGVERAAAAARRERLRLAERQVGERVLDRVDAAQDHHVGRAGLQLANGQGGGRQRRAAGCVDGVVRAAQVQAIGDPAGGDVEQEAGKRVLGPLGQQTLARLHGLRGRPRGGPCRAWADTSGRRSPWRAGRPRRPCRARRRSVRGGTGARRSRRRRAQLANDLERDQLRGLDRRQARRGHSVANRVEGDVGEKPAPLRDDLVGRLGIGVVIEPPVPAVGRDLGDGVDALERIRPESRNARRAGQHGRHADDGDVGWLAGGAGTRLAKLPRGRRPGQRERVLASESSWWRLAIVVVWLRRAATWPSM